LFSAAAALRKPAVNITIHKLSDGVNISEPGASEQFLDRHNDPPGHGKLTTLLFDSSHRYTEHDNRN